MAATPYSVHISIDLMNLPEVQAALKNFPNKVRAVIRATIIDSLKITRTAIVKEITDRYAISAAGLLDPDHRAKFKMEDVLPASSLSEDELVGGVRVISDRFPVMRFSVSPQSVPNQKGIPVSERVVVSRTMVKGETNTGTPNRFLARMQSGHLGVFKRKPDATHRRRPDGQNTQLNIEEEFMISPSEMVRGKAIRPKIDMRIEEYIGPRFLRRMELRGLISPQ
jgi:hypothetical protein